MSKQENITLVFRAAISAPSGNISMDSPAIIRDGTTDKFDFIVMPMQL